MTQPDIDTGFPNNYFIQIIETGFFDQASQDGVCADLFENLSVKSLKRDLLNNTTVNLPLFSSISTFKVCKKYKYDR
jgi:hypothetical protein